MDFILQLLFNIRYFVGYIQNGVFPPKLSEEEEKRAIEELFVESTHEDARIRLIEHNLRLVAHIAKKYESVNDSNEDLISIGTLGLIKAIDSFQIDKDVKLATYAAKCIENEILMTLRSNKRSLKSVSLFDAIGTDKDGSEITWMDVFPSDEEKVSDQLEREQNITALLKYLEVLNDRELQILSLRYGLQKKKNIRKEKLPKCMGFREVMFPALKNVRLQNFYKNSKKTNKSVIIWYNINRGVKVCNSMVFI